MVVVDTEEEFDWSRPHSRAEVGVSHIRHQDRGQRIFDKFGLRPTYVVDFPVASQEQAFPLLRDWRQAERCQIGAHLHPWVNPPFDEDVSARNSYPGNLPAHLEQEKLARLTDVIERNFGARPRVYRAGRYGVGQATADILAGLGYEIDLSVMPRTDFRHDGGPDFTEYSEEPYWFGPNGGLLEIPATAVWYGSFSGYGKAIQPIVMTDVGMRLHLPGILARLGLFERIRLTPEGVSYNELKRLTDAMLAAGKRLFSFSYHSPSLVPGNTPYVRTEAELQRFLGVIERYCEYFFGACGGVPTTPDAVRSLLLDQHAARAPVALSPA
jgi:hypothetical protein